MHRLPEQQMKVQISGPVGLGTSGRRLTLCQIYTATVRISTHQRRPLKDGL